MENKKKKKIPFEHIRSIYQEYTRPTRLLQSFTNLSNTVIQTALSGQSKFIFEILQNADDAFEDENRPIYVKFILQDGFLIVHHNGKGFDYNDVERICDYASQITEVKANDLSKTGYKGLGFKSLFNLSDCIYIHSNGYSFRFDKTHWHNPEERPWQIIPIWCDYRDLPLHETFPHDQPVNFILKLKDVEQLRNQLIEVINQPELLLFLHRVDVLNVILREGGYFIQRIKSECPPFNKVEFFINQQKVSTWLLTLFNAHVPIKVNKSIKDFSKYIYPDKIKSAKNVPITFALCVDAAIEKVNKVNGLCYGTLPTQLHLKLPYHVNSLFILNLDRTQLHENEWNAFLINRIGHLQLKLLQYIAMFLHLRNYVIELLVRDVDHPYQAFRKAFHIGFEEAQKEIGWLPTHQGHLLKMGEAWTDPIEFFRQNFPNIRDHTIFPFIISYDVQSQFLLQKSEAKVFDYVTLLKYFPEKYYPQLTELGYINFIDYLFKNLRSSHRARGFLKSTPFLRAKDGSLICPRGAWLEDSENPLPGFLNLNPVDYRFLPPNNAAHIKAWLIELGAKPLKTPVDIIRESILENSIEINDRNHIEVINYLARNYKDLTNRDFDKLKTKKLVLTESRNQLALPHLCYFPDAVPLKELKDVLANDEKISSDYEMESLKEFFIHLGVHDKLDPLDVFRRSIFKWVKSKNDMKFYLNVENYAPIMEYVAGHYFEIEKILYPYEKAELRKLLVLTSSNKLERAEKCFFDTAIPAVQGLETIVAANKLVSTKNISDEMKKFLTAIGVSTLLKPSEVIRRSVLQWINQNEIQQRITINNHINVLEYIAKHWLSMSESDLTFEEMNTLSRILIMTKGNKLREACQCYWSVEDHTGIEDIPEIESVIPLDAFVSPNYSRNVKNFIQYLNIRTLKFANIYEQYSNHLSKPNNINWFFSKLVKYWQQKRDNDKLLKNLQKKFKTSQLLLGKDEKMYRSTELYSSQLFQTIHAIYPNSMPLLCYEKIPEDLELWLGFRRELDMPCIVRLFDMMYKKPLKGEKDTETFFTMLLKQLRLKGKSEVKKYKLSLLAKNNELQPAKSLYYFKEEEAECIVESCYLKRIHSMSHKDTLELADLCGVNILPFKQHVTFEEPKCDSSLKEFYLERLPFIVIKEAKMLNEQCSVILKRLYDKICCVVLYQCRVINVEYPPFGNSKTRHHFEELKLYVTRKWTNFNFKSKIHSYIKEKIHITAYINDIIDMESIMQDDIDDWLDENKEDFNKFNSIREQLHLLQNKKDIDVLVPTPENKKDTDLLVPTPENKKDTDLLVPTPENKKVDLENSSDVRVNGKSDSVTSPIIEMAESEDDTDIDETGSVASSLDEDVADVNTEWTGLGRSASDDRVNEYLTDYDVSQLLKDTKMQHSTTPGNFSLAEAISRAEEAFVIRVESLGVVPESSEKLQIQRLGETYAFTFLQDHYKNKYPNSDFSVSGGVFTLCYDPPRKKYVEINWINESQEKKYPYDISLKKDGDIRRLIEVNSSSAADGDSFDVSHLKFIKRMNRLAEFQPLHKQKYCLYRVLNVENSLATSASAKNIPTALYKVMLLKNS